MAFSRGPVIVRDGLVLHYDAANIKSFRGEPTTNQYSNPDFSNSTTSWTFNTWDATRYSYSVETIIGPFGIPVQALKVIRTSSDTSSAHFHQGNGGKYVSGNTYTLSAYVKGSGTIVKNAQSGFSGNTGAETLTNEWRRIEYTLSSTTSVNYPYWAAESITQNVPMYFTLAQSEQKPYATFFTTGSRGTTVATGGGLIDLSKNGNSGELSGPVYNSSNKGGLVFDGTDDYVFTTGVQTSDYMSMACWFKTSTQQVNKYLVAMGTNLTGNNGFDLTFQNTQIGSYISVSGSNSGGVLYTTNYYDGNWHHICTTYDGTVARFYYDGVEVATRTGMSGFITIESTKRLNIGSWVNNSVNANASITLVSLYNRSLTATEVLQNYNATKGRFI